MKVLYIDGDGPLGGASRSLFEVVRPLSVSDVEPYFVMARGTASEFYRQVAKDIIATRGLTKFDNTRYSHYRGLRWFILLRELFHLPYTVTAMLRARLRWRSFDIIHVNEVLCIVPGLIAKAMFGAPLVIHVRSPARKDPRSIRGRLLTYLLRKYADAIVAIDENTRLTLADDLDVDVVHNSFTPKPAEQPDATFLEKLDVLRPDVLKVGFVGNLHVSKGLFELVEAAEIVRAAGRQVDYVIIGGETVSDKGLKAWMLRKAGLAQNVRDELLKKIRQAGVADAFHLLGPTFDIQRAYERMDVVAFPSHFDSPGRPVFEAAFSGVPAIVSVANPRPDTLVDRETGLAIPMRNAQKLADAILYFADHLAEAKRMGANAKRLALANFHPADNSRRLYAIYRRAIASSGRARVAGSEAESEGKSLP